MRFITLLFTVTGAFAADVKVMEEIIAKINGDIVTRSEIERDHRQLEATLKQQGLAGARLDEALKIASANLLRDRIDNLLLIQKGKELNLNVDSDVNREMAEIQRRVTAENPEMADPEKFQAFVREQTGMSYEDYKGETKSRFLTQRVVREEVGRRVPIKKEELRAYYDAHKNEFIRKDQVFLREILVAVKDRNNPDAAAAAEKKAKDLVARARRGERFPEMAQQNSDSATAQQGGGLDPYQKGVLSPAIEATVWDKERGYVTDPIRIDTGFLILKVDEHQKEGQAEFEDVENEVQDRIFQTRMEPALRAYLTKLRQESFLEIKAGYEDTAAAPGKDTTWTDPAELKPQTITKEEVAAKGRRKRLLWTIPVPGTTSDKTGTSSSR
jgi:peptidyl-prolyl cis-trans isomerase SurA